MESVSYHLNRLAKNVIQDISDVTFRRFVHPLLPFVLLPDVGAEGLAIFGLEVAIFRSRTTEPLVLSIAVFLVSMQVKLKKKDHIRNF